ncbi:MAG: tRNA (adenosine(37)-N6)-dimethylallyltransferase MiaA [Candidatus Hydrogenedentes bacterium]|nr:tRNA (adenosine(37)-N6)-dimethylallyltransferase MiaA [Candidatus Hydrogenedentota bacterium]
MIEARPNTVVVLGPTASGKTALGVRLAQALQGEVLSADSRQVYRGLDIGSGKDLGEYVVDGEAIPCHLIDIVDLSCEFSVFEYQERFFEAFAAVRGRGKLPVVVGGTGLYIDAVVSGYTLRKAPEDPVLRRELEALPDDALVARLLALRPKQHNTTDLRGRARMIRAIEIATHEKNTSDESNQSGRSDQSGSESRVQRVRPLLLGTAWPREELRRRIGERLRARMAQGLVEEVAALHAAGHSWARLELLGLEYRFVAQYLQGQIRHENDLYQKLASAITQFAKRQETWFRRMERHGHVIHWIPRADFQAALQVVHERS